ncbi:Protein CROWDED NUCLEI 4 [Glycine soja]|uniref:Protein CROWDED NUCLEI 4 n=1 Tax=Glycine soja TaxID=3848 RepID=A0A445M5J6_GLYSO|nr:Protein CROWDED NUCLEI 4 [Glycine soja]
MGCLIFERKELASKYEQVKASIDSSEFMCKHDSTMTLSALIEARKREESLKKAVGVTEACIISAESKVSEAHQLIDEAQKKSTEAEAEAKLLAAASFQAKACGYNGVAGRKLRDVEAREDELKRQIISFKSDYVPLHFSVYKYFLWRILCIVLYMDAKDEALSKRESELNKKERELLDFQVKLASRESLSYKLVENEIEMRRRAWELKEVDLTQREEQLLERKHELEILSRTLGEKEKDLLDMSSALKEKDQSLKASEKELELNKVVLQKEKEEINITKLDEEIALVRSQKLEIVAEADKLKAEKAKFEVEWELLDEKKEELQKEAEYIAEAKKAVSAFIKKEYDKLRQEKENMRDQYKRDLESVTCEREEFMTKMADRPMTMDLQDTRQERADFLRDVEMQKRNMNTPIEKRHEEIESYLKEREKSFEEEKNNELEYINALKEKAAKESQQVSFEMRRLETERAEISLDREQRKKEWAELNKCIEELKVQRDKLQNQRELLHADRIEIHAQTGELKKLKDLKIVFDDIAD